MKPEVSIDIFKEQWLTEITDGAPSTVELGRRFARKIITQWLDFDDSSDDLVFCDGSGDGGIDVAYLDRDSNGSDDDTASHGHTWYLVQSKYGSAFQGTTTLIQEGQKIIDTLDGKRPRLSSLAEGLLERLTVFMSQASERDKVVLVFATVEPLTVEQKRALQDLRNMGRGRIGAQFDVEPISVETIYQRTQEEPADFLLNRNKISLVAELVPSGKDLFVGAATLPAIYNFLKAYRDKTDDLDQLYEKNVRKFLGSRGKVNKAVQETLRTAPQQFGLYNNGITIVVADFNKSENGSIELVDPYVVNGCQTTRTIWEVCHQRLEAGGTGSSPELEAWQQNLKNGVVVVKIVRVGDEGEELLSAITRYTNSQNAVKEKDFIALSHDFRTWAKDMADKYNVFLEIQRGGWDARQALQKQRAELSQFKDASNSFDLIKIYAAGWMGEAGLAFGKNNPFLPNGNIFKRIMNQEDDDMPFGVDDLYAAYLLNNSTKQYGFGRGASKPSRRQTRYLFYMVVLELLKDIIVRAGMPSTRKYQTKAILKLFRSEHEESMKLLLDSACEFIDSYLTQGTEECLFDEDAYKNAFAYDLNAYLKWEQIGKNDASTPKFRALLVLTKSLLGRRSGGQASPREAITAVIKDEPIIN